MYDVHKVEPDSGPSVMTTPIRITARRIADGDILVLDGGISSELERRGVPMVDGLWSALAGRDHWQTLVDVHRAYIDAGADVITTNTFAASRLMLAPAGLASEIGDIHARTVEAALTARELCGAPGILVAGSMSHMLPIFADGTRPGNGRPATSDEMLAAFREQAGLLKTAGVDLLLLEMMRLPDRMAQMFAALESSDLPVWCGLSAERADGHLISAGTGRAFSFADSVAMAQAQNFDVLGIMHSQPDVISEAIPIIRSVHSGPVMAYPDAGHFKMPRWHFSKSYAPEEFSDDCGHWRAAGAQVVGGCCGLGPEHIAAAASLKRC